MQHIINIDIHLRMYHRSRGRKIIKFLTMNIVNVNRKAECPT